MTASQPSGPSSELRTETMVLAIPHSESEMWTGGSEGGREGAEGRSEGESVLRQEGEEEKREQEREVGGKIGSVLQPQEG